MRLEIIQNNYLHVPGFITDDEAQLLAKEFKEYCKKFNIQGDPQAPNSHAMYNFLPFVKLLVKKISHVNELLGEEVLPTYTYARIYKNGEILARHRDRPACEISLTVHIGGDASWSIGIQKPTGEEVNLNLNVGDAMLYLGCVADHWRDTSFSGQNYSQVFLHYVRSNGSNAWAYFDKQQQQSPTASVTDLPVTIL